MPNDSMQSTLVISDTLIYSCENFTELLHHSQPPSVLLRMQKNDYELFVKYAFYVSCKHQLYTLFHSAEDMRVKHTSRTSQKETIPNHTFAEASDTIQKTQPLNNKS